MARWWVTKDSSVVRKKLVIAGSAVAVLLILGLAVLLLTGKEAAHKPAGKENITETGEHGEKGRGGALSASTTLYQLEPFVIHIFDGQELRHLKVSMELEMANPAAKTELDARLEPIRNTVVVLLSVKSIQEILDVTGKNQLKDEIQAAINRIVSPNAVTRIYYVDFIVQ